MEKEFRIKGEGVEKKSDLWGWPETEEMSRKVPARHPCRAVWGMRITCGYWRKNKNSIGRGIGGRSQVDCALALGKGGGGVPSQRKGALEGQKKALVDCIQGRK